MSNLRLQNLLYEKEHYEADIRACLRHQSEFSDADVELMSTEEFQQSACANGLSLGTNTEVGALTMYDDICARD